MRTKRPLKHYIVVVQFHSSTADSPWRPFIDDVGYFLVQATYPGGARDKVAKACGWAEMEGKGFVDWEWPHILSTRVINLDREVQRI